MRVALRGGVFCLFIVAALASPYRVVLITGASMKPAYSPGDVCVVREEAAYTAGDVVLVDQADGGRVVHRIVAVRSGRYVTKGDANESVDRDTVGATQIRGAVVGRAGCKELLSGWIARVSGGTLHNQSHS